MRTKKHYDDLLKQNPNTVVGFTLAADMVFAARHGLIDAPRVHGDEEWKNIARNLKTEYGDVLSIDEVRQIVSLEAPHRLD